MGLEHVETNHDTVINDKDISKTKLSQTQLKGNSAGKRVFGCENHGFRQIVLQTNQTILIYIYMCVCVYVCVCLHSMRPLENWENYSIFETTGWNGKSNHNGDIMRYKQKHGAIGLLFHQAHERWVSVIYIYIYISSDLLSQQIAGMSLDTTNKKDSIITLRCSMRFVATPFKKY